MKTATLYSDGGARGNPGPAGIGYVIFIDGQDAIEGNAYIGETTNNQAEYKALLAGLVRARKEDVTVVACYLDSELVVKQLKGQYRVKNADLKPLFEQAKRLAREFAEISFAHIPREKNAIADRLVNEAIDRARR